MTSCRARRCPECHDRLIHQNRRGMNESSSGFGQHIHDVYPAEFWWTDIDGVIYKRATRIMRVIEAKPLDGMPSMGQRAILAMLADTIDVLIYDDRVDKQSGVFIVKSDPPYHVGEVTQLGGGLADGMPVLLDPHLFTLFKTGMPLPSLERSIP